MDKISKTGNKFDKSGLISKATPSETENLIIKYAEIPIITPKKILDDKELTLSWFKICGSDKMTIETNRNGLKSRPYNSLR